MGRKEVGIYLINKKKFEEGLSNQEITNRIRDCIGDAYKEIKIEQDIVDGYNIELYNKISHSVDDWNNFWNVKEIAKSEDKIVDGKRANNYIALIYGDNNIFCVTTNMAYNDINDYIVYFYGVCVMSHYIKDDDKIRSATYSNIMSNFLGGSEYLGEEYHTTIDKYWNRVNRSLMAEIDKKRLYNQLGIENKRKNTSVRCDAKDSFTICSKIDLKDLITVIKNLDAISNDELTDKFNTIEKVKDDELKNILKQEMIKKIYNDYKDNKLDLCIVHKDIEKFFESMSYSFIYKSDSGHICETIPSNEFMKELFDEIGICSEDGMKSVIEEMQLICLDSSNHSILSGKFNQFVNVSIEYDGNEYVFQHNMWFKLTDNYIENLKESFKFIKGKFKENDIEFKKWENLTEGQYIDLYDEEDNFYKIHPCTENKIEICDLMYFDRDSQEVKLIYFKIGFGASTRDLSIQVSMGLQRLLSIIRDDDKIKEFYNKYIKDKTPLYSYKDFKKDIKTYSKNAVMVYKLPKGKKEDSNIGKQSVISAKNEVEKLGRCKFSMMQL